LLFVFGFHAAFVVAATGDEGGEAQRRLFSRFQWEPHTITN
jgi:hypothetical protein